MKAQIIDACVIPNLTMTLEPAVAFGNHASGGGEVGVGERLILFKTKICDFPYSFYDLT